MNGFCLAALLIAAVGAGAAGAVLAQVTSPPSIGPAPAGDASPQQILEVCRESRAWARWACILAGLALLAGLRAVWSLQTVAKNEVAIAEFIQARKE